MKLTGTSQTKHALTSFQNKYTRKKTISYAPQIQKCWVSQFMIRKTVHQSYNHAKAHKDQVPGSSSHFYLNNNVGVESPLRSCCCFYNSLLQKSPAGSLRRHTPLAARLSSQSSSRTVESASLLRCHAQRAAVAFTTLSRPCPKLASLISESRASLWFF